MEMEKSKNGGERDKQRATKRSMTELPREIVIDILSRLPIKNILICRCVCKTLLNLISVDPQFAKLHFTRALPCALLLTDFRERFSRTLYLVDLEGLVSETKLHTKFNLPKREAKAKDTTKDKLAKGVFDIVNSCNGLLCLCKHFLENPSIICNPITGQYITLPKPKKKCNSVKFIGGVVSGFGFIPKTKEYKVLRVFYHGFINLRTSRATIFREAEILTIGSGSWRSIGQAPASPRASFFATFLNGAIHWRCDDFKTCDFIISFDFEKERFGTVPPPPHFGLDKKYKIAKISMGVLEDYLYMCDFTFEDHFDEGIWC